MKGKTIIGGLGPSLLVLILIFVTESSGQLSCIETHVPEVEKDPKNCYSLTNVKERAREGSQFSFGSLDDFCLITRISTKLEYKLRKDDDPPRYDGVGATQFPKLVELVAGRAWSYNADYKLDSANINWQRIRQGYDKTYFTEVQSKRNNATQLEHSIAEIRDKAAKFNQIQFPPDAPVFPWQAAQTALTDAETDYQTKLTAWNAKVAAPGGTTDPKPTRDPVVIARHGMYKAVMDAAANTADTEDKIEEASREANQSEWLLTHFQTSLKKLTFLKDETPDFEAPNPYFIETSGIKVDGEILKNYLHFRVFFNRSVSDDLSRLHTASERKDNARGRIAALLIVVKDQKGNPVGDFSNPIPCSKTCNDYGRNIYSHNGTNDIPCAYTPDTATTHPGIFFFPRAGEETKEGFQEMHATWSFTQDSCNFVTKLHIQTLILEDFKRRPGADSYWPVQFKSMKGQEQTQIDTYFPAPPPRPRPSPLSWTPPGDDPDVHPKEHIYGWTARFDIIHPTIKSLGSPDYVNIRRLKNLDRRGSFIDCHVPIKDHPGFIRGIPVSHGGDGGMPKSIALPLAVMSLHQPSFHYYGVHTTGSRETCSTPLPLKRAPENITIAQLNKMQTLDRYLQQKGVFCPCPGLPTSPRPEDQTPNPSRLHGRLLHGSHMAMAWLVLVPLSWFVARYYKETFASLFCLQEYWWYMWHICIIFAAALFGLGGFVSIMSRNRQETLQHTDEWIAHTVLGYISFVFFFVQIGIGFFRYENPAKRKWQIMGHFILACINQLCALAAIIVISFVKQSGLSCNGLYTLIGWIIFWCIMFGIMEWHIHAMDSKMKLNPPRSYLPPPVKRLFGQDAPGRVFRAVMLLIFIVGQLLFYWVLNSYIWGSKGWSCRDQLGDPAPDDTPDYGSANFYSY